jgi:hypothetical protein
MRLADSVVDELTLEAATTKRVLDRVPSTVCVSSSMDFKAARAGSSSRGGASSASTIPLDCVVSPSIDRILAVTGKRYKGGVFHTRWSAGQRPVNMKRIRPIRRRRPQRDHQARLERIPRRPGRSTYSFGHVETIGPGPRSRAEPGRRTR